MYSPLTCRGRCSARSPITTPSPPIRGHHHPRHTTRQQRHGGPATPHRPTNVVRLPSAVLAPGSAKVCAGQWCTGDDPFQTPVFDSLLCRLRARSICPADPPIGTTLLLSSMGSTLGLSAWPRVSQQCAV